MIDLRQQNESMPYLNESFDFTLVVFGSVCLTCILHLSMTISEKSSDPFMSFILPPVICWIEISEFVWFLSEISFIS